MSAAPDSSMILVIVRQTDDVELARALIDALGDELRFYLLFTQEELRDRFGDARCPQGLDSLACMLNPQHFGLVVSFWGMRDPSPATNVLLLSFFNEVGVPTLEIQHAWLQEGTIAPVGLAETSLVPQGAPLPRGYAARRFVSWEGADGIGYLKSELSRESYPFQRDDLLLVTSQLESSAYSEKQRYQFAIAVLKLAAARPELQLVWPVRPAEQGQAVFSMVEEHALSNLTLDKNEPMEAWVPRCRLGISTPSTALLEYQLAGKPALVHLGAAPDVIRTRFAAQGFHNYFELERAFERACEAPAEFSIDTGVGRLNRERLRAQLVQELRSGDLAQEWLPIALRYIGYMREGRTARIEIGKVAGAVAALDRKLASVEQRFSELETRISGLDGALAGVTREFPGLRSRLSGIADRVGLLQRSTLSYKARKFVAKWSGKSDGEAPAE